MWTRLEIQLQRKLLKLFHRVPVRISANERRLYKLKKTSIESVEIIEENIYHQKSNKNLSTNFDCHTYEYIS